MKPCEFAPTGVWPAITLAQSATRSHTGSMLSTRTRKDGRVSRSLLCFTYSLTLLVAIAISGVTKPDWRRPHNGLMLRPTMAPSGPTPTPWAQIVPHSWVVTPKHAGTRAWPGRAPGCDE